MFDIILNSTSDESAMEAFFGAAMEGPLADRANLPTSGPNGGKVKSILKSIADAVKGLFDKISGWVSGPFQAIKRQLSKIKVRKKDKADYMSLKQRVMKRLSALPNLLTKIKTALKSGKDVEADANDEAVVANESYAAMEAAYDDGDREFENGDWDVMNLDQEQSFLDKMKAGLKAIQSFLASAGSAAINSKASPLHWLIKAAKAIASAVSAAFSRLTRFVSDQRNAKAEKKAVKASFAQQDKAVADSKDENWA